MITIASGQVSRGRAAFERYIAAFHARDWDTFVCFYAPDVRLTLRGRVFNGREQLKAYWTKKYDKVHEHLEVHQLVIDDTGVAMYVTPSFTALDDAPDFFEHVPLVKGDKITLNSIVFYRLRDGMMIDMRIVSANPVQTLERSRLSLT